MKHRDELLETRPRGLDRCHSRMLQIGFCKYLFVGMTTLDHLDPSKKMMRMFEFKTFILFEPTENTVDQHNDYRELRLVQ